MKSAKKFLCLVLAVVMLVGMCLFVGLNYLGQRFFAFAKKEDQEKQ